MLLFADLRRHLGEDTGEIGELALLLGQLGQHRIVIFVSCERVRRISQISEWTVHAVQSLTELANDREGNHWKVRGEAHQAVAVDPEHDEIGMRHHSRGARHVGKGAELADNAVPTDRGHMNAPGRDLDKDVGLALDDQVGEAAGVPLAHDCRPGLEPVETASRRGFEKGGPIELREVGCSASTRVISSAITEAAVASGPADC